MVRIEIGNGVEVPLTRYIYQISVVVDDQDVPSRRNPFDSTLIMFRHQPWNDNGRCLGVMRQSFHGYDVAKSRRDLLCMLGARRDEDRASLCERATSEGPWLAHRCRRHWSWSG